MGKNILIVGVGGQGTLLASKLLGKIFVEEGYDVKVSEVHGMSQRGGSVVTYVKYDTQVFSPVIEKGEADIIISFEQLEAARWLPYLKKGGIIITNTHSIYPMPVIMGIARYPEDIIAKLKDMNITVISQDAEAIAANAGSIKSVNIVLLGITAKYLGLPEDKWINAVKETVPAKTVDINVNAFKLAYGTQI